ncbi:MAG: AbrB/MazE/SpoVT family DNA-binding domain-containing protein [Candidatus Hodarchaeales archaeon]
MTTIEEYETRIGSKGEIFLNKKLREKLGFLPFIPVILTVNGDQLVIRKKKRFVDIIRETPVNYRLSRKTQEKLDREINESLES